MSKLYPAKTHTKNKSIDDHYHCPHCNFTCTWSNQDYRERGEPVCPHDDNDMEYHENMEAVPTDSKLFIGVEYRSDPDEPEHTTYEIFDSVEDACNFRDTLCDLFVYFFVADVNNYYRDVIDNEPVWNYDDEFDTLTNQIIIKL